MAHTTATTLLIVGLLTLHATTAAAAPSTAAPVIPLVDQVNGSDWLAALARFSADHPDLVEQIDADPTMGYDGTPTGLQGAFPCAAESLGASESNPTSVHELRPGDISVVASLGDSITAAFGAESRTLLTITTEYRGMSWSIGGDDGLSGHVSLPNIIRAFNGDQVTGFSLGTGKANSPLAGLNVAVSGAIAKDMPGQAHTLIEKLKGDERINFEEDWKVITLWIGGNDLCAVCKGNIDNQPTQYAAYIEEALDILLANVPRAYVNLVSIIDVTRLHDASSFLCSILHLYECPCVATTQKKRDIVTANAKLYQELIERVGTQAKYQTGDFSVNVQPFFIDTQVPRTEKGKADLTFFAKDCFHFSKKAHAAAATALWNNMLQLVGEKELSWHIGESISCPTAKQPFLCTPTNGCGDPAKQHQIKEHNMQIKLQNELKPGSTSPVIAGLIGIVGGIAVATAVLLYRKYRDPERHLAAGYVEIQ